MKITLGGDRLGSGNKNKIALRNYERSTHNLTQNFTSSMQCGTLYPFICIPAMRGDKFDIDLTADARTVPTKGPLFGSFKMQIDLFQCDIRLYQAILHNNPLAIGLNMSQVKFPRLQIVDSAKGKPFSNNCLLKYLGLSGLGTRQGNVGYVDREINAIPALAYYEIFKTYYSNKQEEYAYTIGTELRNIYPAGAEFEIHTNTDKTCEVCDYSDIYSENAEIDTTYPVKISPTDSEITPVGWQNTLYIAWGNVDAEDNYTIIKVEKISDLIKNGKATFREEENSLYTIYRSELINLNIECNRISLCYNVNDNTNGLYTYEKRGLQPFALSNIDDMRLKLLSWHQLGTPFKIWGDAEDDGYWGTDSGTDNTGLPYTNLVETFDPGYGHISMNCLNMNGLVVKTYQSDLYNNWVNTEWIDGENGIANVTAISTASGAIKIDSLNLSEKLYNMLNRIAVSDGSYEGWQDAVYTETPKRHIESPIYLGGMSSEIVFDAIVQTAPTDESPLGTLGGKGVLIKNKGGHVTVKCNEACFIIGIVSLTPRINYSQGNEFYMTDLLSMDDFHKPALDGIGFQNLIGERLAWWDTKITNHEIVSRSTIGKVPAWIEYMTAVDKTYGDFAETEGRGFMALNREYGRTNDDKIQDATTYIDPRKYNYAFAYTDIDAQNFWVQIHSDIKARRLMSAKQIPNI